MRSRGGRNPTPRQEKAMTYYFTRTLDMPFDRAVAHVTEALAAKGFGVLTTIDVQATMKKKLDVDFKPYVILGACNPKLAWGALQAEDKIGTMLPCNVIVTEAAPGKVEVAAVDPVASMSAIRNPALGEIAGNVRQMLSDVVDGL
jgi:uncharacterized protein (DUF302 family)